MFEIICLIQLITCAFLTGLIWVIQLVHYPSFHYVDRKKFLAFNQYHQAAITVIVLPMMIFELFSAMALFYLYPKQPILQISLLLVIIIWLSTFFLSVPCHNKLLKEKKSETIKTLVKTNWIRTVAWSIRLGLASYLVYQLIEKI
jgi:hypothetical protein